MSDSFHDFLLDAIGEYIQCARESFQERMDDWDVDIFEKEVNEVVGGLLARQLSLATTIAQCPLAWNMHLLPVALRCMADVYITFCWIVKDVKPRSRQFIEYGLGQEKIAIEKYRECLAAESDPDPHAVEMIEAREKLLDAERYRFLIPVNLGSWSETSIRDMAIEVGEKQFYDLVFTQFSAPVHSTWQHIWRMNLYPCSNPLHMGHRVPWDPDLPPDPQTFTNSAKYLCKTFAKFDAVVLQEDGDSDAYKCYDLIWSRFADYFTRDESDDETAPKKTRKTASRKKKR
ncbi:DUF5677 domain-containing protein [Blastopirellula sp. J2-11]|uniref:DUF5677 domain-containing protein n=1 Tax=Blastopirellula sp. J2-11 TaxID=2943192 RepID=UPI0021CAE32B|nr:DUF5677 domain-containing protein [Blastopirellula sp. J2-11]UUO08690.1 DUF5677 domain-containing protein [Blastopirellula sp. J2-11]